MLPGRCVIRVQIDLLRQILQLSGLTRPSYCFSLSHRRRSICPIYAAKSGKQILTKSPEHKRGIDASREISRDAIALFTSKGARHAQFRGLTATGQLID